MIENIMIVEVEDEVVYNLINRIINFIIYNN